MHMEAEVENENSIKKQQSKVHDMIVIVEDLSGQPDGAVNDKSLEQRQLSDISSVAMIPLH